MRLNKAGVETGNEAKHTHGHAYIHFYVQQPHPYTLTPSSTVSSPPASAPTRVCAIHLEGPPSKIRAIHVSQSLGGFSSTAKLQVAEAAENRKAPLCNGSQEHCRRLATAVQYRLPAGVRTASGKEYNWKFAEGLQQIWLLGAMTPKSVL